MSGIIAVKNTGRSEVFNKKTLHYQLETLIAYDINHEDSKDSTDKKSNFRLKSLL